MIIHRLTRSVTLAVVALGLSACASRPTTQLRALDASEKISHAATHADTRLAFFRDGKFCAEPMPDALREETLKLLLDRKHKGAVSVKAGKEANVTVGVDLENNTRAELERAQIMREMAGRNSYVLVARELMYRLCELSLNHAEDSPNYKELLAAYNTLAQGLLEQGRAESSRAAAAEAIASTELLKITDGAHKGADATRHRKMAIIELLVEKQRGCHDEATDAALLERAAKGADALSPITAMKALTTCGALQEFLDLYPLTVLDGIYRTLADAKAKPAESEPPEGATPTGATPAGEPKDLKPKSQTKKTN